MIYLGFQALAKFRTYRLRAIIDFDLLKLTLAFLDESMRRYPRERGRIWVVGAGDGVFKREAADDGRRVATGI